MLALYQAFACISPVYVTAIKRGGGVLLASHGGVLESRPNSKKKTTIHHLSWTRHAATPRDANQTAASRETAAGPSRRCSFLKNRSRGAASRSRRSSRGWWPCAFEASKGPMRTRRRRWGVLDRRERPASRRFWPRGRRVGRERCTTKPQISVGTLVRATRFRPGTKKQNRLSSALRC